MSGAGHEIRVRVAEPLGGRAHGRHAALVEGHGIEAADLADLDAEPDVVGDGQREQEQLQSERDTWAEEGQHTDGERDVGGHGDTPAV